MLQSLVKEIISLSALQPTSTTPSTELLQQTWTALVGEELARCTLPVAWNDGVLDLEVSSPRWLDEFSRQRARLRTKIARLLPWPLVDIRLSIATPANAEKFITNPSAKTNAPDLPPENTQPAPNSQQLAEEMNLAPADLASLEGLDEELRVNLLLIRQRILQRQNNPPR